MKSPTHKKGSTQLFNSKLLEFLSRTTPTITLLTFLPIIFCCLYLAYFEKHFAIGRIALIYVGALFFWTLFEYVFHRFVFHIVGESKGAKRFRYVLHGIHHEYPLDPERLFMPPLPGILLSATLFGIFYIFLGQWIWAFFPGFLSGYLMYVFTHYAIHKYKPPKALKFIWKHHSHHHYKDDERAFGVSNIFWDRIFGTMPKN